MPRARKYPEELLERGARLVFESGRPIAHVAAIWDPPGDAAQVTCARPRPTRASARTSSRARSARRSKQLRREISSCAAPTRSSRRLRCFSRGSSTQTDRSERVRRGAPRRFGVEPICETLDVSASAYYQRAPGERSARCLEDDRLLAANPRTTRGQLLRLWLRRTWKALCAPARGRSLTGSQRLMRATASRAPSGAASRGARPSRSRGPAPGGSRGARLRTPAPNELWFADFTYLRCWEGLVFFSFVIDVFSRKDRRLAVRRPHAHDARARRAEDGAEHAEPGRRCRA